MALAAPAVVRASLIMPIRDPKLVRGIFIHENGSVWGKPPAVAATSWLDRVERPQWTRKEIPWKSFEPLPMGRESLRHEVVWLHESDPRVQEYRQIERQSAAFAQPAYEMSLEERAARPRPPWFSSDIKSNRRRLSNIDVKTAVQASLPKSYMLQDGNVPITPAHRSYGGILIPSSIYDPRYALDAA